MPQMINWWCPGVKRHDVHLVTKVAGDSRVYKRHHRVLRNASRCNISSPVSFARAPVRELFPTRADYCHLLAFEHRRCEHCRLDRMSPRSFLGNSVTFLLTLLRADISSLTCAQGWVFISNAPSWLAFQHPFRMLKMSRLIANILSQIKSDTLLIL